MGIDFSLILTSILKPLSDEIQKILINNKSISKEKDIIKYLSSFLLSQNFNDLAIISFCAEEEMKGNESKSIKKKIEKEFNEYYFLYFIVKVIEMNEHLLSLKILFPLIEELINKNFENQLQKIRASNHKKIMEKILGDFSQNISNNSGDLNKIMNPEIFEKLVEKPKNLKTITIFFFYFISFKIVFDGKKFQSKNDCYTNIIKYGNEFTKNFLNALDALKFPEIHFHFELKNTKCLYNSILKLSNLINFILKLYGLNLNEKVEKNIKQILNISDKKNNSLEFLLSEDKFIWVLFDKKKKNDKEIVLFGNINENKNILYNDIFEILNINEKNSSINTFICKSLIDQTEIIIIKIFLEYYKKNETPFELIEKELNKEIDEIHKANPSVKNINIFFQKDNEIFSNKESLLKEEFDKYKKKPENSIKEKKEINISKEENDKETQQLKNKLNDA